MNSLILFGAGASYGQAGPGSPPLGSCLFEELARCGHEWSASDLKPRFEGKDFEQAMRDLLDEEVSAGTTNPKIVSSWRAGTPPPRSVRLQWEMAAFFFRAVLLPGSLYQRFVERAEGSLRDGSLRVATLNYDRLLFQAFKQASVPFDVTGQDRQPVRICLPHGSSALAGPAALRTDGRLVVSGKGVELNPTRGGGIASAGSVTYISTDDDFERERRDNQLPPIISFIEPNKGSPAAYNYILAERQRLVRWIAKAERVALVGVRVHESDAHIWTPLANTSAKIHYVGGRSAGEFNEWQKAKRTVPCPPASISFWEDAFYKVLESLGVGGVPSGYV